MLASSFYVLIRQDKTMYNLHYLDKNQKLHSEQVAHFTLVSVIVASLLLTACSSNPWSGPVNCYGLGNDWCVQQGYRTDQSMPEDVTIYDLQKAKQEKRKNINE